MFVLLCRPHSVALLWQMLDDVLQEIIVHFHVIKQDIYAYSVNVV